MDLINFLLPEGSVIFNQKTKIDKINILNKNK